MSKIAIIGTGAASASTYNALIKFGIAKEDIDIFSPNKINDIRGTSVKNKTLKFSPIKLRGDKRIKFKSKLKYEISGSSEFGGWTNYWGATVFKWPLETYSDISFLKDSLENCYSEIDEFVKPKIPIDLQKSFYSGNMHKNIKNPNKLFASVDQTHDMDLKFKYSNSTLAIGEYSKDIAKGCNNCGECLSGCPGGHIWNSAQCFERVDIKDAIVTKIISDSGSYKLVYLDHDDDETVSSSYEQVFVAAGSLQTCVLLINSGFADRAMLSQNHMELVPFRMRHNKVIGGYKRISLSEVFIWSNERADEQNFFMQCYGMNSQIKERLPGNFFLKSKNFGRAFDLILNRVGIGMIFHDSNVSPKIEIRRNEKDIVEIVEDNKLRLPEARSLKRYGFKENGIKFFWSLAKKTSTGESYHYGNAIFYAQNSKLAFNAELGEFEEFPNLTIVDSTSLPILPCYPVTYTIMANAFRIVKLKMEFE